MLTRSSVRCMAARSRAQATATPRSWGITRCWLPGQVAARCWTSASALARPTRSAASFASLTSCSGGYRALARPARFCCAPTPAFTTPSSAHGSPPTGVLYSIGVRQTTAAIALIPEAAWVALVDYPKAGEAQIAETTTLEGERLIVRRVRTLGVQAQLFETWRHFAALTNRTEPLALVEAASRSRDRRARDPRPRRPSARARPLRPVRPPTPPGQ